MNATIAVIIAGLAFFGSIVLFLYVMGKETYYLEK